MRHAGFIFHNLPMITFCVTRQAVAKYLAVPNRAGLVESRRSGREVRYSVRPEHIDIAVRAMAKVAARLGRSARGDQAARGGPSSAQPHRQRTAAISQSSGGTTPDGRPKHVESHSGHIWLRRFRCVTAVSQIPGIRQISGDTEGHEGPAMRVQEGTGGHLGIRKDMPRRRFGTVRPKLAEVLTAKLTAILSDNCARQRTSADPSC